MPEEDGELGFRISQLRHDVDDLAEAVEFLPGRLTDLDEHVSDLRRSLRHAEARAAEADTTMRDLAALIKRLDARVEWLERSIRLADAMPVVELDDVADELVTAAAQAEAGNVAAAELLSAANRSALEGRVSAHAEAVRARRHHQELALGASRVLAGTAPSDPDHWQAAGDFGTCLAAMQDAAKRTRELAAGAVEAAEELTVDESRRVARADVIAAGQRAWDWLQQELRTVVADAVGAGALLPNWFTRVLGPIPPAEDTAAWMDVATSLLAYRVTYAVTDPVAALGPEPGDGDGAHRRAWHHQLRRRMRELAR